MGIPGYTKEFIFNRVRQSLKYKPFPEIDLLAFDLNGLIHKARIAVLGETNQIPPGRDLIWVVNEISTQTIKFIEETLEELPPQSTLLLMVDGVAPGAKLQQQRGRRILAVKSAVDTVDGFDRNWITPGTEFMIILDTKIKQWLANPNIRHKLPPKIVYSNHLIPGEGEHKIFEYLRANPTDSTKIQVIFGLDADLLMLSLVSPANNIYLCREEFDYLISIPELTAYIGSLMPNNAQANHDFVVAMMFLGNDFLPHIVTLARLGSTIDILLGLLQQNSQPLVRDSQINIPGLAEFLLRLSTLEAQLLDQLIQLNQKDLLYPKSTILTQAGATEDKLSTFTSLWYQQALAPRAPAHYVLLIQNLIGMDLTPDLTEGAYAMADNYLQMLAWVYMYYTQGTAAINQDLMYSYHQAPLLTTLATQINDQSFRFVNQAANPLMTEFTVLHQLVAVLPYKSRNLLPKELLPLLALDSPIRDMFPETVDVELEFIIVNEQKRLTYDKEIALMPFVDRQRIVDAVSLLAFPADRLAVFAPEPEYVDISNAEQQRLYASGLITKRLAKVSRPAGLQEPFVFNGSAGRNDRNSERAARGRGSQVNRRGGGTQTARRRTNIPSGASGVGQTGGVGQVAPIPGGYVPRPIHGNIAQPVAGNVNWVNRPPVI